MDGSGISSSDILGIELGRSVVRGALLDEETAQIIGAAECAIISSGRSEDLNDDPLTNPLEVSPSLDDLLYQLGIEDRANARVGLSIGPRFSGVGSGPALQGWLEQHAESLRQPLLCAGDLGVAFVPSGAVEAAVSACRESGLELIRVDLAPVAAARVLGDEVEDAISVGSGRGWRARLRDFEVLEAMESAEVSEDDPLRVIRRDGLAGPISRYSWVEVSPELRRTMRFDFGQLAPAVGAAIGVAYGSPANLLLGKPVSGPVSSGPKTVKRPIPANQVKPESARQQPARGEDVDAFLEQTDVSAESTIRLTGRPNIQRRPVDPERGRRDQTSTGLSPLTNPARGRNRGENDESDPINLFSPDTDLEKELNKSDSRLDLILGFLVVLAICAVLAYLFLS